MRVEAGPYVTELGSGKKIHTDRPIGRELGQMLDLALAGRSPHTVLAIELDEGGVVVETLGTPKIVDGKVNVRRERCSI